MLKQIISFCFDKQKSAFLCNFRIVILEFYNFDQPEEDLTFTASNMAAPMTVRNAHVFLSFSRIYAGVYAMKAA